MTAQRPAQGFGSNSEGRKRREQAVDPHAGCTPGTCRTDEQWRTVSCAPPAVVPNDLPEIGLLRPGQLWVLPGPGPIAAELERLHTIGQARHDQISDDDWEWFCAHPLKQHPRVRWGELGWLVHQGQDPALVPVVVHGAGSTTRPWVLLTADGEYREVAA